MTIDLTGHASLITGAGSGIGRAASLLFARSGARVGVADIRPDSAEKVVAEIRASGGEAMPVICDVKDSASVQNMVRTAADAFGRIDSFFHNAMNVPLVNNHDRRCPDLKEEVWNEIIQLVLTGTFHCCKYVGRQMIAQKKGSIILTATTDALIGQAGLDAYTAAKGGVVAMTRSMAAGVADDGVRVNAICPGFVATEPQREWLQNPEARRTMHAMHLLPIAEPEDIAAFALFLASDRSRVMTGGIYPVDSGYTAFKGRADTMSLLHVSEPPTS